MNTETVIMLFVILATVLLCAVVKRWRKQDLELARKLEETKARARAAVEEERRRLELCPDRHDETYATCAYIGTSPDWHKR